VKLLPVTVHAYHGAPVMFATYYLFIFCRGGSEDGGFSDVVLTIFPM
jgi:hypothetical protein